MQRPSPILAGPLFAPLHEEQIVLLRGLRPDEWDLPTVCPGWSVKDVAAHLLDSALRRLSMQRDGHSVPFDGDLVSFINRMNGEWVSTARRLSPRVLVEMLGTYGSQLVDHLVSLDPYAPAAWGVSWAGEETSPNWFDVARELTERWIHQQQIRDAAGRPPLTAYLATVIDTFVRALPYTYRDVQAPDGTAVSFAIDDGAWSLVRENARWELYAGADGAASTRVEMSGDTAWRLFTKGLKRDEAAKRTRIEGVREHGQAVLDMLCIVG